MVATDTRNVVGPQCVRVSLGAFEDRHSYEVSGGMKQRERHAVRSLDDPDLLPTDEPFGAIDAVNREQLNAPLHALRLHSPMNSLVTYSIPEAVYLADHAVIMSVRPGRLVEELNIDRPRPRPVAMLSGTCEFDAYRHQTRDVLDEAGVFRTVDLARTGSGD